jgi:hypothetical protein
MVRTDRIEVAQIMSRRRTVVQRTSKQIDSSGQVVGLGRVYLATKGIISLAHLTKS